MAEEESPSVETDETIVATERYFKNEMLILISAPLLSEELKPIQALSVQREIDDIVDILKNLPIEIEVKVKIATTDSIIEAFNNWKNQLIIHFIGHGTKNEEGISLVLEDKAGIARPFSARELRNLLNKRNNPPCQLALLNACHSEGLAKELLDADVSHVIAVNFEDSILDEAARCFAKHFYNNLFNFSKVQDAYEQGKSAVMVVDELKDLFNPKTLQPVNLEEASKFRLLPKNSQIHQKPLTFQSLSGGKIIYPQWEKTNIESEDLSFIGRRLEIHKIAIDLIDKGKRCILLRGMGGMGKTALARAVGRWQHERRRWQDGVWFISLRNVDSADTARTAIMNTIILLEANATEKGIKSNQEMVEVFKSFNLLLILDDVDSLLKNDEKGLKDLLSALLLIRKVKLLVTSRKVLPPDLFHEQKEVLKVDSEVAEQIFKTYAPSEEKWGSGDLKDLISFLDGYPLAIQITATYMKQRRCSLHTLWERLQDEYRKVLGTDAIERNLIASLNLSYNVLPNEAKEIFPLLALFPGGLTEEAAKFIFGKDSIESLETLFLYSMAEKEQTHSPWCLPEPARRYAEDKQQLPDSVKKYAPKALEYYHRFVQILNDSLEKEEISKQYVQQQIFAEQANLKHFLNWGYRQEFSKDGICYSARITALLGNYWQWVIPGRNFLDSIKTAFQTANRNQDRIGKADLYKAQGDIQLSSDRLIVAKESYKKAIEIYESIIQNLKFPLEKAQIHKKIGMVWEKYPNTEKALENYLTAFHLYDSRREVLKASHILIIIGDLQQSAQSLEQALNSYQEALERYQFKEYKQGIKRAENRIRKFLNSFETVTVDRRGTIKREKKESPSFEEKLPNDIVLEMIYIKSGKFMMGSPEGEEYDNEKPQHEVAVSTFFIGANLITQAQWRAVAALPKVNHDLNPEPSYFRGDDRPVEQVSWYDAVEFCDRLSQYTGKQYRLPSEAEWEYACRAETITPFHFGETVTGDLANYNASNTFADEPTGKYRQETTNVKQFSPNAFGLYDMHGNVWEWCFDDWHDNYEGAPIDGSAWVESDNDHCSQVLRGGSWNSTPWNCRSAFRFDGGSNLNVTFSGLRVVFSVALSKL